MDQTTIEVPEKSTLHEALKILNEKLFKPKEYSILAKNESVIAAGLICLVNDTEYELWGGLKKRITDKDVITLISSLHGG